MGEHGAAAVEKCPLQCSLAVKVLRKDTRASVDSAAILLKERQETRNLGAAGVVSFDGLQPGHYTVAVQEAISRGEPAVGLPLENEIDLAAGGHKQIEILVAIQDWKVAEVEIASESEEQDSEAEAPEKADWKLGEIEIASESEEGAGDETAEEEQPWALAEVEIQSESEEGASESTPDETGETSWTLDEIKMDDPEDGGEQDSEAE